MTIKNLRIIFIVFALLTGVIGAVYHFINTESYHVNTNVSIFIITAVCLALFGLSFLKQIKKSPKVILHPFKFTISLWFIIVTYLNDFPPDYSYCLIFVTLMLSMVYSDAISFAIFYMACFILLLVLTYISTAPLIELSTFLFLYIASGFFMFFILRSKERTQHELDRAQLNAQAIFHSSIGFFFFLDKDFNIVSFNKFAEEIYLTEMHVKLEIGKSIFQFMPPDSHESLRNTLNKCSNGEVIKNEKRAIFPDGPSVWVENTFIPVYDSKKKFLGISFQTVNIDDRRKMEEDLKESEEKFYQIAENIDDGLWIGTQNKFLYINDAFEKIWGRKKEDLIKDPSILGRSIFPDDLKELEKKHPGRRKESDSTDERYRIIRPDGEIRWVWARRFPVFDKDGNLFRTVGIINDITDQINSQAKLSEQNEFLQTLIDTIPNPIFYKDEKGNYIGCNKAFETNIGGKKEDLMGKSVYELSPKDLADVYFKKDNELFENPGYQIYEAKVKFLDGSNHDVIFHKATFFKNDDSIGGLVGVIVDITERKKFEDALHLSEKRFKEMADTLPLLVYETDEHGKITYFNKAGYAYTGYTIDDFNKGITLPMMFPPGEMERAVENAKRTMSGISVGSIEYTLVRKDGSFYTAIINTVPITWGGKVVGRRGVVMDISELKKAEEKIKASLKEKEILLSEIHHRVKNNLQIISSILRLQTQSVNDKRINDTFLDAQQRIITMGLVHEKLYKSENFAKIDVREYISDLVRSISSSYSLAPERISVEYNIEPVLIHLDTMIPIGLILNELLTNSMKYAFPDGREGIIRITLKRMGDVYRMSVSDNGIGFPETNIENSPSLGLRLVSTLCEQINGKLNYSNHNGSSFDIDFSESARTQG